MHWMLHAAETYIMLHDTARTFDAMFRQCGSARTARVAPQLPKPVRAQLRLLIRGSVLAAAHRGQREAAARAWPAQVAGPAAVRAHGAQALETELARGPHP